KRLARHDTRAGRKSSRETASDSGADAATTDWAARTVASRAVGSWCSWRHAARRILRVRRASAEQHPNCADQQRENQHRDPGKMQCRPPNRTERRFSTPIEPELSFELGNRTWILLWETRRELLRASELGASETQLA